MKNMERTDAENTRTTGALIGGAILGAALGGPLGAVAGGLFGITAGEWTNRSQRQQKDTRMHAKGQTVKKSNTIN